MSIYVEIAFGGVSKCWISLFFVNAYLNSLLNQRKKDNTKINTVLKLHAQQCCCRREAEALKDLGY
jgi:hypothetical protein